MEFRNGGDGPDAFAGALLIVDAMDDIRLMRSFCEGMAGVKKRDRKE